jgi:hypothetical protein
MLQKLRLGFAMLLCLGAPALAQSQLTPEQIRTTLFTGLSLLSGPGSMPNKFRWVFRHDGWWARETLDKSSPDVGGRWRLTGNGFCITPYSYLLRNPVQPNGPETCFTAQAIGPSRWSITQVGSSNPPSVLVSELAASESSMFANADPKWVAAWKSETAARAFQQNSLSPAPAFADGFLGYIHQNKPELLVRGYTETVQAVQREKPYTWAYPPKYVSTYDRTNYRPGESCTIATKVSQTLVQPGGALSSFAGYVLIERPIVRFGGCTRSGAGASPAYASAENARYLFHPERITAALREGAIDDTVSPQLRTACDLACRGGSTCIQGPHNEGRSVGHGLTARTTYVGSAEAAGALCAAIGNLQAALEPVHVKYTASVALDKTRRGPCAPPGFSGYPWFGKGTAAQHATLEQVRIPDEACLEKAQMDSNFPFQGVTRGEVTLTLRYPVGVWASCFTDTPLHAKQDCAARAVPIGGTRLMRATIAF